VLRGEETDDSERRANLGGSHSQAVLLIRILVGVFLSGGTQKFLFSGERTKQARKGIRERRRDR